MPNKETNHRRKCKVEKVVEELDLDKLARELKKNNKSKPQFKGDKKQNNGKNNKNNNNKSKDFKNKDDKSKKPQNKENHQKQNKNKKPYPKKDKVDK